MGVPLTVGRCHSALLRRPLVGAVPREVQALSLWGSQSRNGKEEWT